MKRMPALLLLAAAVFFTAAGCVRPQPPQPAPPAQQTVEGGKAPAPAPMAALRFVPEMMPFPEQKWPRCPAGAFAQETQDALAAWAKLHATAAPRITAERARELSLWAKAQMEKYAAVPPLGDIAFTPAGAAPGKRLLLLEGTADTLPSHSPLVTRWLKIFLVYDCETRSIREVIVTIRGELQE
jgi:hypothetical protein